MRTVWNIIKSPVITEKALAAKEESQEKQQLLTFRVDRRAITDGPLVLTAESVDRRSVAVGLTNGTVTVLDATSGTHLSAIEGDGSRLERLAFDNEGRLSIAWSSGRSVLIGTVDLV